MIKKENISDLGKATNLAKELWADNTYEELEKELLTFIDSDSVAILLFESEGSIDDYSQVSIRNDYVEG